MYFLLLCKDAGGLLLAILAVGTSSTIAGMMRRMRMGTGGASGATVVSFRGSNFRQRESV